MRWPAVLSVLVLLAHKGHGADIVFYGDLMLSRGIEKYMRQEGPYPVEKTIAAFLPMGAVNVANLEGCMSSDPCGREDSALCFGILPSRMELLTGFQVLSLQNNHALDAGPASLRATVRKLESMGIAALAGDKCSAIVTTPQGNIGIIAATDISNGKKDPANLTAADSPALPDEIRGLSRVCSAVIVYVHWGRELLPVATDRMRELAAEYVSAGADIVVGAHTHVVGPVAAVEGRPIVYSLGNFLFDQKYPVTKTGAILHCDIGEDGILRTGLSACTTPLNAFLPQPAPGTPFIEENKVLANCAREVIRKWTGTFTSPGKNETLALHPDKANKGLWHIELRSPRDKKPTKRTPPMPIRKLQPVDLNLDGVDEVMLIQSIYSKFDKETAKRIHIYSFRDGFHALWRGTALSRPLLDAAFITEADSTYLVALHSNDSFLLRNKSTPGRIITVYRWNGFGFSGLRDIPADEGCDGVSFIAGSLRLSAKGITRRIISVDEISGRGVRMGWAVD